MYQLTDRSTCNTGYILNLLKLGGLYNGKLILHEDVKDQVQRYIPRVHWRLEL